MSKKDIDKMFEDANAILDAFDKATEAIVSVKEIIEDNETFKNLVEPYNEVRGTVISFVVLLGIVTLIEPDEIVWLNDEEESNG